MHEVRIDSSKKSLVRVSSGELSPASPDYPDRAPRLFSTSFSDPDRNPSRSSVTYL